MPVDPSQAMDRIERRLRRLEIDFQRFFSGNLEVPPLEQTESLQATFRIIRSSGHLSMSESYRLGALEARFTSSSQLYQRRLHEMEMHVSARPQRSPAPTAATSDLTARSDTSAGLDILVGRTDGPRSFDRLYENLYPETEDGQRKVSRQQFSSYVADQVERIQKRTGCDQVRLQVVSSDGRRRLKVLAIHPSTKSGSDGGSSEA